MQVVIAGDIMRVAEGLDILENLIQSLIEKPFGEPEENAILRLLLYVYNKMLVLHESLLEGEIPEGLRLIDDMKFYEETDAREIYFSRDPEKHKARIEALDKENEKKYLKEWKI